MTVGLFAGLLLVLVALLLVLWARAGAPLLADATAPSGSSAFWRDPELDRVGPFRGHIEVVQAYANGARRCRFINPGLGRDWDRVIGGAPPVVGVFYHLQEAAAFLEGLAQEVRVVREPGNAHDPNALAVWGCWRDLSARPHTALLGYVPREISAKIAQARPADLPLLAIPHSVFIGSTLKVALELSIVIYEPDATNEYWSKRGLTRPARISL